jgi:uncharacterized protein (TIRG00374 family)
MTVDVQAVDVQALPAAPAHPSGRRTMVLRVALGLGVGMLFVLVFLQLIDIGSVSERLTNINPLLVVLCGVAFLSAYAVRALRWRLFLAPDRIPASRIIGIYYIATFLNWLLPFQGGEVAKCVILRRTDGIHVSRSLATVTMDKAMDLFPAVIILTVVPFAQLQVGGSLWVFLLFPLVLLVLGGSVLALASWKRNRTVTLLSRLLRAILPERVANRVEPFIMGFVDTLLDLLRRPRLFLAAGAFTIVAVTLDALFCYLAFRAVGTTLSLPIVLYGYTFYNLAYIFPTPPGHLGSNELIGLLIFSGMFGVSRSGVGAMFLFSHPFTGLLMTVSAVCCIKAIGLDWRTILRLPSTSEAEVDA